MIHFNRRVKGHLDGKFGGAARNHVNPFFAARKLRHRLRRGVRRRRIRNRRRLRRDCDRFNADLLVEQAERRPAGFQDVNRHFRVKAHQFAFRRAAQLRVKQVIVNRRRVLLFRLPPLRGGALQAVQFIEQRFQFVPRQRDFARFDGGQRDFFRHCRGDPAEQHDVQKQDYCQESVQSHHPH